MNRSSWVALLLLFYCGLGWVRAVAIAKIANAGGVHPLGYVFWVAIIAALILTGICAVRGTWPGISIEHFRYYVVIGGLRIVTANVIWYTTVKYVPAGALAVAWADFNFTYGFSLVMRLETFAAIEPLV